MPSQSTMIGHGGMHAYVHLLDPFLYLAYVIVQSVARRSSRGLLPFEIIEFVDRTLATRKFTAECTAAYLATIRKFLSENIAQKLADVRGRHGMFDAMEREDEWDADTDLTMGASSAYKVFPISLLFNLSQGPT